MDKKGRYVYNWPRPMVTVDAAVFSIYGNKVRLLLVNRKDHPFKGKWALPGGFIGIDEEIENAAARELAEETGLTDIPLKQMHTFGKCGRDPRGRQITVVFMGIIKGRGGKIKAGDDASQAKWFDIEKLPDSLAFDHDNVIAFGIRKLKKRKTFR